MVNFIEDHLSADLYIDAKTFLINEGEIAQNIFFIKEGSLRVWFNNDGTDVTTQFFFENEAATSLESFLTGEPSLFTIEAMEPCQIAVFSRNDFDRLMMNDPEFKDWFYQTAVQKLISHSNRLLSFIKNKPSERYSELMSERPFIFQRVPQQYIASYLGITPVSLSRIRNRK